MHEHITHIETDENGEPFITIPIKLWQELQNQHDWRAGDEVGFDFSDGCIRVSNLSKESRKDK